MRFWQVAGSKELERGLPVGTAIITHVTASTTHVTASTTHVTATEAATVDRKVTARRGDTVKRNDP